MRKTALLCMMTALLWSGQASAEYIFRYNISVLANGGVVDPGDPEGPEDPLDCGVVDPSSEFTCVIDDEKVSDDPDVDPLRLVQVATPALADTTNYKFRCLQATGGHGNYIYSIGGYMPPAAVSSLDFVSMSNPNDPARGNVEEFWWPGYDGDYDIVTEESNVCLRLSVNENVDFDEIIGRVWLGDYSDEVVVDGRVDYTQNAYDAHYSVLLKIAGDGLPPSGCGSETCEPEPEEPVLDVIDCPEDDGGPFTCELAEVAPPVGDPENTPPLVFEFLPTPAGAAEDYHGYRCFRIAGGNGNYSLTAEGDMQDWVYGVTVLPYSSPNAVGSDHYYDVYPALIDDENNRTVMVVTAQREYCVRVTPDANFEGAREDSFVTLVVEDYSNEVVVNGNQVDLGETPDAMLRFTASIPGDIFTNPFPWLAVEFGRYQSDREEKVFGTLTERTYAYNAQVGDTRALSFFYKCFTFEDGPQDDVHYSIDNYAYGEGPAWVEWWDIRPFSQLNLPYQYKDPLSPGSSHQYWPMGMAGEIRETTTEDSICIRVKPRFGSTNKESMRFILGRTYADSEGSPEQYMLLHWRVTPR